MKDQVDKSIETVKEGKNGTPPPTPFHVMDVVVKDGQRGKIVYSEFYDPASPEYGKKVTVALIGEISIWSPDVLAAGETVVIGRMVKHQDGTAALVLGITDDGQIKVQDKRTTEIWETADLMLDIPADEIWALRNTLKARDIEIDQLRAETKPATVAAAAGPEWQVEVKTLVQKLTDAMGNPFTEKADKELAAALAGGWWALNISVNTVFDPGDSYLQSVRVVTLERRREIDDPEPEVAKDEEKLIEAVDVPALTVIDPPAETKTVASKPIVVTIEHPEPERQPVAITFHPPVDGDLRSHTMTFEEALANPRMSAAEVAAVGDQIAFARGKAMFEGLQKASSANAAHWSPQSDDCEAGRGRAVAHPYDDDPDGGIHFGGLRIVEGRVR